MLNGAPYSSGVICSISVAEADYAILHLIAHIANKFERVYVTLFKLIEFSSFGAARV